MRLLIANVKLFCQCPFVWVVYSFLLVAYVPQWILVSGSLSLDVRAETILPVGAMIIAFATGLTVSLVQVQGARRSSCFCLPAYRLASRQFLFLAGLCVSLVTSALFVHYVDRDGFSWGQCLLALGTAFYANLTLYFVGALVAFSRVGLRVAYLSVMLFWVLLGLLGLMSSRLLATMGCIIIDSPILMIPLGTIMAAGVWFWMGRPAWSRSIYKKVKRPSVQVLDDRSWYEVDIRTACVRLNHAMQRLIENVFLGVMRHHRDSQSWPYSCGVIYTMLLFCLTRGWNPILVPFLSVLALLMGVYLPETVATWIVVMSVVLTSGIRQAPPSIYTKSFIGAGRHERLHATLVLAGVLCCLCILLVILMVPVSGFLVGLLPDLWRLSPTPLSMRFALFTALIFPLAGILVLASFGRSPLIGFSAMLPSVPVWLNAFWCRSWYLAVPIPYVLAGAALAWVAFAFVVRRVALRTDLWSL